MPGPGLFRRMRIIEWDRRGLSGKFGLRDQRDDRAWGKHHLTPWQLSDPDLGPLQILQNRHGGIESAGNFAQILNGLRMVFISAVGKIETCDVHSGLDELANDLPRTAGGPEGGDNFGTTHDPIKQLRPKNSSRKGPTGCFRSDFDVGIVQSQG